MNDDKVWIVETGTAYPAGTQMIPMRTPIDADSFSVDHGDLVFFAKDGETTQAFAQGRWHRVYEKVEDGTN
ncbi:MAG TPA: hypothetical protein DCP69_01665 [Candidatus Omnitrophica bacterium]|nr:hypothetical protein [Candidatus Omnitrophota bacterium]